MRDEYSVKITLKDAKKTEVTKTFKGIGSCKEDGTSYKFEHLAAAKAKKCLKIAQKEAGSLGIQKILTSQHIVFGVDDAAPTTLKTALKKTARAPRMAALTSQPPDLSQMNGGASSSDSDSSSDTDSESSSDSDSSSKSDKDKSSSDSDSDSSSSDSDSDSDSD
jgi:hypothetical protein